MIIIKDKYLLLSNLTYLSTRLKNDKRSNKITSGKKGGIFGKPFFGK